MTSIAIFLALTLPGGIAGIAIWVIIVAAIVGIVLVALPQFGVSIPAWVIKVFWIVVVAAVCIAAIKLLLTI